jgi:hypothetical protein
MSVDRRSRRRIIHTMCVSPGDHGEDARLGCEEVQSGRGNPWRYAVYVFLLKVWPASL